MIRIVKSKSDVLGLRLPFGFAVGVCWLPQDASGIERFINAKNYWSQGKPCWDLRILWFMVGRVSN